MQINLYTIQKIEDQAEVKELTKMISRWAKISEINKFNAKISKAQKLGTELSLRAYDEAYLPCVSGFCICLDERGQEMSSAEFAKLLDGKSCVNFFIGGAYGLSSELKSKMDFTISLSKMTFTHKIAKLMLYEQIFRGLSINNNHPYNK